MNWCHTYFCLQILVISSLIISTQLFLIANPSLHNDLMSYIVFRDHSTDDLFTRYFIFFVMSPVSILKNCVVPGNHVLPYSVIISCWILSLAWSCSLLLATVAPREGIYGVCGYRPTWWGGSFSVILYTTFELEELQTWKKGYTCCTWENRLCEMYVLYSDLLCMQETSCIKLSTFL